MFSLQRNHSFLIMVICLLLAWNIIGCSRTIEHPLAEKGVLDLSSWDFKNNGPVKLNGEWKFWWGEIPDSPTDLNLSPKFSGYISVPGLWKNQNVDGSLLPAHGLGTYSLQIKLPSGYQEPSSPVSMSMLVSGAMSVCRLWINNELVAASGIPGNNRQREIPEKHILSPHFQVQSQNLNIILGVSNFHNLQGGISNSLFLGLEEDIQGILNTRRMSGVFMVSALLIISLYHLILFSRQTQRKANLYFALLCLFLGLANLFNPASGFLMTVVGPDIPWNWYINFSLLPYGLTIPFLVMFYHSLFPKKYGWLINCFVLGCGMIYMIYILLTPPNAYGTGPFIYYFASRIAYIYLIAAFVLDLKNREKGAPYLVPGYVALALSEMDEMIFDLNITTSIAFAPYGVLIFILSYSLYISATYAEVFSRTDKLSRNLQKARQKLAEIDKANRGVLSPRDSEAVKRELAVLVMNLSIKFWDEATGGNRADLAEQSGIWSIYIEKDGYARTQTLNKYLSQSTLPDRPKWKNVLATANFVLNSFDKPSPQRLELEKVLNRLMRML